MRAFGVYLAIAVSVAGLAYVAHAFGPVWLPKRWIMPGAVALGLLCLFGWFYSRAADEDAKTARAVIGHFLLYIALPLTVVLGLPLLALAAVLDADPRLMQALIAGVVIAIGWLTTAIFAELETQRRRAERLRDYHKAIFAEIRNSLQVFWNDGTARRDAAHIVRAMRRDTDFVPFIPHEVHDRIYHSVLDEIETLPRASIDLVVAYYSKVAFMTALAEDMRSSEFRATGFDQKRRIRLYLDFFATRSQAYGLGQDVLDVIDAYSKGGKDAAEAKLDEINSRDAGRRTGHPVVSE